MNTVYLGGIAFGLLSLGFSGGLAMAHRQAESKCAASEETARLDLCTKRGGAYVDGKCFGPLPAPEGAPEGK